MTPHFRFFLLLTIVFVLGVFVGQSNEEPVPSDPLRVEQFEQHYKRGWDDASRHYSIALQHRNQSAAGSEGR